MKLKSFLVISIFFLVLKKSTISNSLGERKLPVFISFAKQQPPDSLMDFVKVYIQAKGYQTINEKEAMESVFEEIQNSREKYLNSGNYNNNPNASTIPVCNVFWIKIFNDTNESTYYKIDSIHWKINLLPIKDSGSYLQKYVPKGIKEGDNEYSLLKSFVENVISTGYLKRIK